MNDYPAFYKLLDIVYYNGEVIDFAETTEYRMAFKSGIELWR